MHYTINTCSYIMVSTYTDSQLSYQLFCMDFVIKSVGQCIFYTVRNDNKAARIFR